MTITLYGIPNCDTVKKARKWLEGNGVSYAFHDYKKAGADKDKLTNWIIEAGLEKILNRSGTTFKKLPEEIRAMVDENLAVSLMVENPSMIKRPIVEYKGGLLVGFKASEWETALR
ncbi:arsenate reductase [Novosphingobium sediminicola]|uniref:Spx/MgsR family transcriptional regulator n=1 Tax=Novosphingobium sediminicola TaxID=563162 RepID=A0A7W6CE39_9SPHN|nr:arsenate reductase [Novosphingobium sediminicola]MBB3954843.1 Spx/MgsR family transcriptional regulator [Novosphingobium sediminicola]